jgi:hypothetical protein
MNTLEKMIAKADQETSVRKRAISLRDDGDALLETMTQEKMAADGLSHLDAYDAVVKSELGGSILRHRDEASRLIESQSAQE